jgi:Protein of unknown function (DUF1573)
MPDGTTRLTTGKRTALLIGGFFVFGLLGGAVAVVTTNSQFGASAESTPLQVAARDLDFGVVPCDPKFQWSVPIRNTTNAAINLTQIDASCSCTVVDASKFVIPAGESRSVRLTIDLTSGQGEPTYESPRSFSVMLAARSPSLPGGGQSWQVRGLVRDVLVFSPREIDLGEVAADESNCPPASVRFQSAIPLREVTPVYDRQLFHVELRDTRAENQSQALVVQLIHPGELGDRSATVGLDAKTEDGERMPRALVPLRWKSVGDIATTPPVGHLGALDVGASRRESVRVYSRRARRFSITKTAVSDAEQATVAASLYPSDGSYTLDIEIRAKRPGEHFCALDVHWAHAHEETARDMAVQTGRVTIPLRFLGVQSCGGDSKADQRLPGKGESLANGSLEK